MDYHAGRQNVLGGYVEFWEDAIGIFDNRSRQVVYWNIEEWKQDPEVVFSISNAVFIATKFGVDRVKQVVGFDTLRYPRR